MTSLFFNDDLITNLLHQAPSVPILTAPTFNIFPILDTTPALNTFPVVFNAPAGIIKSNSPLSPLMNNLKGLFD